MKISGFTIARNAVRFGYPLEESLRSLLPLVDELIVGVGDGEDGTWELVQGIGDPRLKPFRSVWDMKAEGGEVLSVQTNLALSRCQGDWAMYLQADEVLHENQLATLRAAMEAHLGQATEGLEFRYLHFYGSYATVQDHWRKWYGRAVRAVKTGRGVESVGDAYGFKVRQPGGGLRSLRKADSGALIHHYGWARPPEVMLEKQKNLDRMYHDEAWILEHYAGAQGKVEGFYRDRGHLKHFTGTHPQVMASRVAAQDWTFDHGIESQRPDWLRHLYILLLYPLVRKLKRLW